MTQWTRTFDTQNWNLQESQLMLGCNHFLWSQIEKSFLKPLSAELRITPILLPSSHVRERPPWFLFSRNSSSLSRPHSLPPPLKQTVLDKRPKTERVVKAAVSSEDRLDREKECLYVYSTHSMVGFVTVNSFFICSRQHEVEMLQRKLEEQHKILSDKIEKVLIFRLSDKPRKLITEG